MLSRISNSETKAAVFNLSRTAPEGVPNSLNFTPYLRPLATR